MVADTLVILVAMTSIQSGASLAKSLFPVVGAPGVTVLRLALGTLDSGGALGYGGYVFFLGAARRRYRNGPALGR